MLSVKGTYENGKVKLDKAIKFNKKTKVIVTFLEEEKPSSKEYLTKDDFSFEQARESGKEYKGDVADAVTEERRES